MNTKTTANERRWPDARMGLVTVKPLAGEGATTSTVCHYCGEPDGHHTGQCPTVSLGGAS